MDRRRLGSGDLIFGRYEVIALAGVGATSFVYRCRDGEDREVAVKVLHDDLMGDKAARRRFLREAHLLKQLDHPNIVKVHDIIETPLMLAYAMDHVEGQTLKAWLRDRASAGFDAEARIIALELLSALGHIHAQGVIHRDIKPANIMLDSVTLDGVSGCARIRLIDFGVARLTDADPDPEDIEAIRGTAAYISPDEIRSPFEVCPASDLYSLGVVFYEMAAGERPFEGRPGPELLCAHLHTTPLRPSHHNDGLNEHLDALIMRLLAKTPEARFGSCVELERALVQALAADLEIDIPIVVEEAPTLDLQWLAMLQVVLMHLLMTVLSTGNTGQPDDPHHFSRPYIDFPAVV